MGGPIGRSSSHSSNLGTTQYRLRDFKTAEETYLRAVKIVEDSGGGADRALLRPLHGLGATYFATGQYEDAEPDTETRSRSEPQSRRLVQPRADVDSRSLIDSLVALDRHEEAERAFDYSIRVAETAYGKTDLRVLRPLNRSAHWQERMGRYTTARILYARALQIAEQAEGGVSVHTIEPLEGIARTYRLEFVNGGDPTSYRRYGGPVAPAPNWIPP